MSSPSLQLKKAQSTHCTKTGSWSAQTPTSSSKSSTVLPCCLSRTGQGVFIRDPSLRGADPHDYLSVTGGRLANGAVEMKKKSEAEGFFDDGLTYLFLD